MLTRTHKVRWLVGVACACLVLATAVGCGEQTRRTSATRQPVMSLSAGDSLGQAMFRGGTARTILAAKEAEQTDTRVADAE